MGTCQRAALLGRMVSTSLSLGTCLSAPVFTGREAEGHRGVHTPKADRNEREAASYLQRWEKVLSKHDRPSVAQSPPVPAEPSPHLCEQPADLTLTEQVGAAARERGVHGSSVRLDYLHTHETHGQSAPAPGGEGLAISKGTALTIPTMYAHSVFPKV